MNLTETKKTFWINSFFISIVYFFIRRADIRASGLDLDEILTWNLARMPWSEFVSTIYHDTQQPLYYALLKGINYLVPFSNDELIRYPSLFFGLGTLLVFYHYGLKYFGVTVTALAALFLVSHQEYKYLSTYARPYAFLYFLVMINALSLIEIYYKKNKEIRHLNLFFITSFFICLGHYLAYFYFLTLFIGMLLFKPEHSVLPSEWKKWWKPAKIWASILFLFCYAGLTFYQYKFKTYLLWIPDVDKGFLPGIKDAFNPSPVMPKTIMAVLLASIVYFIYKKSRSADEDKKEVFFLAFMPFIGVLIFYLFSKLILSLFIAKYLLIFLPFYLLFLCHCLKFYDIHKYSGIVLFAALVLISFKGFEKNESLWKFDAKIFLNDLSQKGILKKDDKIYCNTPNMYARIFTNYSQIFFDRDICSSYRAHDREEIIGNYQYIINVKSQTRDNLYLEKIKDFHPYFSSRDVELLKRN